jgi:sialate O-acetylesterase
MSCKQNRLNAAVVLFCIIGISSLCIAAGEAPGELRLPRLFSDNMALQSGISVPVWGWDKPLQKVTVSISGQEKSAEADSNGKWMLKLDPLKAGEETAMTVKGSKTITLKNVIVGDVWLCAGQSNMNLPIGGASNGLKEMRKANYPKIRIFAVPMHPSPAKEFEDVGEPWGCMRGTWLECSPESIGGFSAVAYYFGREIHRDVGVPVGLIVTVWGGVGLEYFFSWDMLRDNPECKPVLELAEQWMKEKYPEKKVRHEAALAAYEKAKLEVAPPKDDKGWEAVDFDDRAWEIVVLPKTGTNIQGVVWYRKTVGIPTEWKGKPLLMKSGIIHDNDTTYVNGKRLGETSGWTTPREYEIPAELTRDGRVTIAIRVLSAGGVNIIRGEPEGMALSPIGLGKATPLSLASDWKRMVAESHPPLPVAWDMQYNPAAVYNGVVAPLAPYAIRGMLWYQGESGGHMYEKLFPILISSYRKKWGQGDFPFLYVQLPNLINKDPKVEDSWVSVREAQLKTLSVTNTGMAVTIDVGDPNDVHPGNKEPVGLRLALCALAKVYGKDIVYSGPLYDSMTVEGNTIRLKFKHVGGGLVAKDGAELKQLIIAGEDKKFVPANAKIEGDSVIVWNDGISNPVAVRYAWLINPEGCNLYNKEGLPASPFRTDNWPKPATDTK